MALIAEGYARWTDPADEARVRGVLARLCDGWRAGEPIPALMAALPETARLETEALLFELDGLGQRLGHRLTLVLDDLGLHDGVSTYVHHLGLGLGDKMIDRIDDLGATGEDAEVIARALELLLRTFAPARAGHFIFD